MKSIRQPTEILKEAFQAECMAKNPLGTLFVYALMVCHAWFGVEALGQNAATANVEVSVNLLDGSVVRGSIVSADSNQVALQTSNGKLNKTAVEISRLSFANKVESAGKSVEVLLLDGSKAFGDRLIGSSTGWKLSSADGGEVAIQPKTIRAARLKTIPGPMVEAWQTAIKETTESDAVIVVRGTESLDRINGIIIQVQANSVSFELDGQQIEIPLEKLAGLMWFSRGQDRVRPAVEVVATDQSTWLAESFLVSPSGVELQTYLGQKVAIPLSKISSINYATANIKWLSELEVLEAVADKRFSFRS
ncbi:MAG: hypothetical protein ABL921_13410, partial [Pirellula sp.]